MGQDQCCQGTLNVDSELLYRFQNIATSDPIESSQGKLMLSIATSVQNQTFPPSSKEGFIIQTRPELAPQVKNRIRQLNKFVPLGPHFIERGQQKSQFFCFKITGIIYQGQWRQGKPNGWGKSFYPNGGYYEGSFIDGLADGCGRLIMPNGDYYDGDIKFARANGNGLFVTKKGEYRGQFKDNVRHGHGTEKTADLQFTGIFEYGQKKEGQMKFNGTDIYQGQFEQDLFEGKGTLKTSQGVYTGSFRNGLKHGSGQQKWKDGSYYKGHYYQGQREGEGQFLNSKNSSLSRGFWKNGTLQGQGEYIERGKVYKCIWSAGKLVGLRN